MYRKYGPLVVCQYHSKTLPQRGLQLHERLKNEPSQLRGITISLFQKVSRLLCSGTSHGKTHHHRKVIRAFCDRDMQLLAGEKLFPAVPREAGVLRR